LWNAYCNALRYADAQIGRLLTALDNEHLRDNMIIIVTGDHGEAFWESGLTGHAGMPVEVVARVGLIINSPRYVKPAEDNYLAESIDIGPTVLSMADIPVPTAFQGQNLLADDRTPKRERLAFVHCCNAIVSADAVVTGSGWKYVFDHLRERGVLYRISENCKEVPVSHEEFATVAERLKLLLFTWRRQQIAYYKQPQLYTWYYPPLPPLLDSSSADLLEKHAHAYDLWVSRSSP
jgi:hypothetical protein